MTVVLWSDSLEPNFSSTTSNPIVVCSLCCLAGEPYVCSYWGLGLCWCCRFYTFFKIYGCNGLNIFVFQGSILFIFNILRCFGLGILHVTSTHESCGWWTLDVEGFTSLQDFLGFIRGFWFKSFLGLRGFTYLQSFRILLLYRVLKVAWMLGCS